MKGADFFVEFMESLDGIYDDINQSEWMNIDFFTFPALFRWIGLFIFYRRGKKAQRTNVEFDIDSNVEKRMNAVKEAFDFVNNADEVFPSAGLWSRKISNMLNISISTSKTCFLSAFFTKILNTLHFLDEKLNAKNINSNTNNIGGLIIGLIRGSLAILIMVLVFQSIDNISQQYYWIETNGALKAFQDIGLDIKPILSEYLLFIKHD